MDSHKNKDIYKLPKLSKFLADKKRDIKFNEDLDPNNLDFDLLKDILNDNKLQWVFNICQQKYHPTRGNKPFIGESMDKFLNEGQNSLSSSKIKKTEKKEKHEVTQPTVRNFDKILKKEVDETAQISKPFTLTQPSKHQNLKNVLKRMTDSIGPLSTLQKYLLSNSPGQNNTKPQRLRILTRSHSYVRGYCEGYLMAYDHHWNLVLKDVDEYFILDPKIKKIYAPTINCSFTSRHLDQSFSVRPKKQSSILYDEIENQHEEQTASTSYKSITNDTNHMKGILSLSIPPNMTADQNNLHENSCLTNLGYDAVKKCYHRIRHVPTLFVRGDNVVLICQSPNY